MREVKFRGKSTVEIEELERIGIEHDNGWVYGNLIQNGSNPYIVGDLVDVEDEFITHEFWVSVEPRSVGQYTGLKDKNGTEIYEVDVLKRRVHVVMYGTDLNEWVDEIVEVEWREDYAGFFVGERPLYAEVGATIDRSTLCGCTQFEIIGNVFENPELLEGEG